jgi:hypothetical protein
LGESWRQIRFGIAASGKTNCDKSLSEGWYRFVFPDAPYASIPTTRPAIKFTQNDKKSCGTHAVSWLPENLPVIGDPPKDVDISFAWQSNDQYRKKPAKVVACDDQGNTMYLWYLKPAPDCSLGYCAIVI